MQTTKLISLVALTTLAGCAAAPIVITGLGATSLAVTETTGKTISDHAVSAVNNQDCKIVRSLNKEDMCRPDTAVKIQITTTGVKPSSVEEIQSKYR